MVRCAIAIVATVLSLCPTGFAAEPNEAKATTRLEARINGEKWTGDLDGIAKRRILRILVVPTAIGFFFNGSQMQGAMYDMGRQLEKELNKKLKTGNLAIGAVFITVAREELIAKLAAGYGNVAGTMIVPLALIPCPACWRWPRGSLPQSNGGKELQRRFPTRTIPSTPS
jgi:hypothetical protein